MKYQNIREEELKNKVAQDYFLTLDCTPIIGNVDFCVGIFQSDRELFQRESLLWAEAKRGAANPYHSLVQLILTIGKARTFDKYLPPAMLGAFDGEKIAFIPYSDVHDVFYINDFNWNVTPSNHATKEFQLIYERVKAAIDSKALIFHFGTDDKELKRFIKTNFIVGKYGLTKTKIDKNNFMVVYNKWLATVKPSIDVAWDVAKKTGIIDGDFYLADLLSQENKTLKDKLFVLLKHDHYELDRKLTAAGMFNSTRTDFKDRQAAHTQFWNRYDRPPKEEYWDYIVERRDLLVPQDVRERKGSYFTPQIWVELSQKYLADVLGEDWQDEYYVWDCAAGTGNLLAGLTNKYNIWASTLDMQDVEVMRDRIRNGANLLESHVFQFDFLNDDFTKLPQPLQDIIADEEQRKKLVIYINPPYAEHGNVSTRTKSGKAKSGVAQNNNTYDDLSITVGTAARELFVQFFLRIHRDISGCVLASFSKLKHINSQNFSKFRELFRADFQKGFVVPAFTFDNVKGKFPIGFLIWNLSHRLEINVVGTDVYNEDAKLQRCKNFYSSKTEKPISAWLRNYYERTGRIIGYIILPGVDMQAQNGVYFTSEPTASDVLQHKNAGITSNNFEVMCIYLAVRHCIEATWLNDRDQFLFPSDGWKEDEEFQSDCLVFTLFHGQNRISSAQGPNHWIPFTEAEVDAQEKFASAFMSRFIAGTLPEGPAPVLFAEAAPQQRTTPLQFSATASLVFDAGRALWRYYHSQPGVAVNASLYDIREHFQGRNDKGKMNSRSEDETYTGLIAALRQSLKLLALKIEPKVYEYGFLKS